ncbi:MAG: cyclic nucleotide-binding domain-containing protein [Rhodospirillales bacterium]|nr:cyclic nucleotide-binding domain-containing protein [Rhodospirillales bacterium]
MLFDKLISYEVLVGQDNRWILDTTHSAKSDAMTRAQSLFDTNQHDAIRVTRLENDANEEVIFYKECTSKVDKPITISSIDAAAVCNSIDDLSGFEARKTTGRLLRQYLDEWGITALELLHNYENIRQFSRTDTLFNQALHRISSIQARSLNENSTARIDLLFSLASQVEERARDVADTSSYISHLSKKGLSMSLEAIAKDIPENYRIFYTGAVLAGYLGQKRDWKEKLGLVIDLIEQEPGEEAKILLDQMCAEILDGSNAVKELLGPQPDLFSALLMMCQLSVGRYKKDKKSKSVLGRLNAIMNSQQMPFSKGILLERVARSVSGTNPLTRENDETDRKAFLVLFKELIGLGGFTGGVAISEALTRRIRIVLKKGDIDLSPDAGIASVLSLLPNMAVKVGYLLDLSHSDFGVKYQMGVLKPLMKIVEGISSLSGLLPPQTSRDDIIAAVNDMRHRIGSGAVGQEIGVLIEKKLEKLLQEHEPETNNLPPPAVESPPVTEETAKGELQRRVFQAGETIFNEGDAGDEAFMVESGEIEISIKSGENVIILATLGRGQILGEMALIDDQPRMASARAMAVTKLSVIPQEAFKKRLKWLAGEDRLISHLLEIFVGRLRGQARNL